MADTKEVVFPVSNTATLKLWRGLEAGADGSINVSLAVAGNTLANPGIAIFSANQFTVNANGMVQVKPATYTTNGICSFDSSSFVVTSTGRIQMKGATTATRGVVQLASEQEVLNGTEANKVVTPATLEKKLKNFSVTGSSTPTAPQTLLNIKDTNSYPLNNGGNGMILIWNAKQGCWVPSSILQSMFKMLAALVKQSYGGDKAVAEAEDALFSYDKKYDFNVH